MISSIAGIGVGECRAWFRNCSFIDRTADENCLVFIASGLVGGSIAMEDATLFKARGDITQKALLLVPKGALISLRFERPYSEVSILPFTWDGLWFDSWRRQFAISMAGRVIRLMTYVPIAEGHIDMIRPVVENTWNWAREERTRFAAAFSLAALLPRFFTTRLPFRNETFRSKVEHAKSLIEAPSCWEMDLAEIARMVGYTPQGMRKAFLAAYGKTPGECRDAWRRSMVMHYLRQTSLQMKVVCLRLGIKSPSHLAKIVKAMTGMTPSEVRRRRNAAQSR